MESIRGFSFVAPSETAFSRFQLGSGCNRGKWVGEKWCSDAATPKICSSKGNFFTLKKNTLQGTNISPIKGTFEDDFPFPKVGYVSSLQRVSQRNAICWISNCHHVNVADREYRGRENALPCAYKSWWMASNENRVSHQGRNPPWIKGLKQSDKHVTTWSLTVRHWKGIGPQKEKKLPSIIFQGLCQLNFGGCISKIGWWRKISSNIQPLSSTPISTTTRVFAETTLILEPQESPLPRTAWSNFGRRNFEATYAKRVLGTRGWWFNDMAACLGFGFQVSLVMEGDGVCELPKKSSKNS